MVSYKKLTRKLLMLTFLAVSLIASTSGAVQHLSSTTYTTGNNFLSMTGKSEGSVEFDVTPKDGNMAWTSIKSCLGTWPGHNTYLRADLVNLDTGEVYYWQRNSANEACTKEVFDIPVHTFHRLKLRLTCFSNAVKGKTEYCRGWATLFSSVNTN